MRERERNKMVGVLFIVTIPTEQEERNIELYENHMKFGHSSKVDIPKQESEKFEYGTFKIVRNCIRIFFVVFSEILGQFLKVHL